MHCALRHCLCGFMAIGKKEVGTQSCASTCFLPHLHLLSKARAPATSGVCTSHLRRVRLLLKAASRPLGRKGGMGSCMLPAVAPALLRLDVQLRLHTCALACSKTHTRTGWSMCSQVCMCAHVQGHAGRHTQRMSKHTRASTHAHAHACTRAHTHTHTHTHMCAVVHKFRCTQTHPHRLLPRAGPATPCHSAPTRRLRWVRRALRTTTRWRGQ